jgi:hypothetical protein
MAGRVLKAFHLPADERVMTGVYEETLPNLLRRAGIEFMERVNTELLALHRCVMVIDDCGYDRRLPVNRRAQFLSAYPLEHAIVGDALFFGEAMDAESMGIDFINIPQASLDGYLKNSAVHEGYAQWLFSPPVRAFSDHHDLYYYGKDKKPLGFNG